MTNIPIARQVGNASRDTLYKLLCSGDKRLSIAALHELTERIVESSKDNSTIRSAVAANPDHGRVGRS
jgi:hypothetical protein